MKEVGGVRTDYYELRSTHDLSIDSTVTLPSAHASISYENPLFVSRKPDFFCFVFCFYCAQVVL